MFSYLKELRCPECGRTYDPKRINGLCECGKPLLAEYDLERAREVFTKVSLDKREPSLWRYHEVLPVYDPENIVSLGEGMTPLIRVPELGNETGIKGLMVKDEGQIPTGTFKARGASVGVSKCKELGVKAIAMPTNGNAGSAWSSYSARAGIDSYIVMPMDAPHINKLECIMAGAHLYLVDGLISDAGAIVKKAAQRYGMFDVSTLKEPYRIEGKKTMGYEIMEQMGWEQPDVILYPTGGGVGIIGIYRALLELRELGIIDDIRTRLVSVQASGCAPIVKAFREGKEESKYWKDSETVAFGINVPKALGDFMVLDAIRKTNGTAVSVTDEEILRFQRVTSTREGILMCPEGASTVAAARKLREEGWIDQSDRVVLLNTGTGIKYPDVTKIEVPRLERGTEIVI